MVFPPEALVDLGVAGELTIELPLTGWDFTALLSSFDDECSRVQEVPLEAGDPGSFVLRPAGHADSYDVTLFGRGGGDLSVIFTWTTPAEGPLPVPEARLVVLAEHDGAIDSYGVEMEIKNLARTPSEASAMISVTAPNGRAVTFEASREDLGCSEGSVYWGGPGDEGLAAADLDDHGPFTYAVILVLDGVQHVATATWPTDVIIGNEPSVALNFEPSQPALT